MYEQDENVTVKKWSFSLRKEKKTMRWLFFFSSATKSYNNFSPCMLFSSSGSSGSGGVAWQCLVLPSLTITHRNVYRHTHTYLYSHHYPHCQKSQQAKKQKDNNKMNLVVVVAAQQNSS